MRVRGHTAALVRQNDEGTYERLRAAQAEEYELLEPVLSLHVALLSFWPRSHYVGRGLLRAAAAARLAGRLPAAAARLDELSTRQAEPAVLSRGEWEQVQLLWPPQVAHWPLGLLLVEGSQSSLLPSRPS